MNRELTITGASTEAVVKTTDIDEATREQIEEIVDHEAFTEDIVIQSDAHYGAGAVIGFTMPLGPRVVPNTVGMDIGCGMYAVNYGSEITPEYPSLDQEIRQAIPMGFAVHGGGSYHMKNDFPWETCTETLAEFEENVFDGAAITTEWFDGYGIEYFKSVCKRAGEDLNRAISSMGTLGGGNHFIEVAENPSTGDLWCVIHSGSRGIGGSISQLWQERANECRDDRPERIREYLADVPDGYYKFDLETVSDTDLLNWVRGGMGEDWKRMDVVAADHDGEKIQAVKDQLNGAKDIADSSHEHPLNYLEGDERHGYFIDMIFAQRYASENRKEMMRRITEILGTNVTPTDAIESVHNYIDFQDGIIRKGATPARKGERGIVPFNMAVGSLLIEGKGNPEWNYSAPHGAGRRMSRRQAFADLSFDEFKKTMDGVFSTSVTEDTLDEAPMAYKDPTSIEESLTETASIVGRLEPRMNLKADS